MGTEMFLPERFLFCLILPHGPVALEDAEAIITNQRQFPHTNQNQKDS